MYGLGGQYAILFPEQRLFAVSYTHLDVYKRQIHTILQPSGISLTDSKRHAAGEYDQLETGVNMIIQKNHELKTELIKKETREVSNFYKRLLNGMFNREEEALAQLKELNLSFEAKGYCVAVIKAGDTSEKFKDFSLADWGSQRYRVQVMDCLLYTSRCV